MFTSEEINNAISSKRTLVKRGLFLNTPSWENFINHLNFQFHNKEKAEIVESGVPINPEDTIINGVNIREHFYLMIDDPEERFFPGKITPIANLLKEVVPENSEYIGGFTLINFVGGERPINIHSDPRHSFYWQTQGKSIWETWDEFPLKNVKEGGYHDTPDHVDIIGKGDMIFVPHGAWHSVKTDEPRAAISFMYSMNDEDCVFPETCPDHSPAIHTL